MTWGTAAGGSPDWESLAVAVWLLFFAALPFINRDRMRGGDLIAGTMVISLPKRVLSSDLVEKTVRFAFTEQQLRAYGAFELQVLEELLRHPDKPESTRVLNEVCDKICRKIGWSEPVPAGRGRCRSCASSTPPSARFSSASSSTARCAPTNTRNRCANG